MSCPKQGFIRIEMILFIHPILFISTNSVLTWHASGFMMKTDFLRNHSSVEVTTHFVALVSDWFPGRLLWVIHQQNEARVHPSIHEEGSMRRNVIMIA